MVFRPVDVRMIKRREPMTSVGQAEGGDRQIFQRQLVQHGRCQFRVRGRRQPQGHARPGRQQVHPWDISVQDGR
jgi:hypothetical protein